MVSAGVVGEVAEFLEGGASEREAARRFGIARGTVAAIGARRHPRQRRPQGAALVLAFGGPARRCAGCGGLVYEPCVACRVRALVGERGF